MVEFPLLRHQASVMTIFAKKTRHSICYRWLFIAMDSSHEYGVQPNYGGPRAAAAFHNINKLHTLQLQWLH